MTNQSDQSDKEPKVRRAVVSPASGVTKIVGAGAAVPPASTPKPAALEGVTVQAEAQETAVLARLIHGAAAATLLYGDTGSGKTTLLATYAAWAWRKFHVPTRLVAADPGGYSDDILALVKLGIIEVWRIYTRDPLALLGLPSETIQRACQGWWPVEIDPASGECPTGVPLAQPNPDERFAIAFDGLTSMQDWSMVDMGQRSAVGTLGGEGANLKTISSGDMKMGVGNRASVGFTQNKCRDWVLSSLSVPNLVCPPVFTALELKVLDYETKLPLYGPKIAGQAKTTDVPAWFGATLGTCIGRDEKGNRQWRLYLRDYTWPLTDPTPHKAKIRASATLPTNELLKLPEFLADGSNDVPLTYFNLGYLFDRLEEVRRGTLDRAAVAFPDAPGLKKSTIGVLRVGRVALPAQVAPPGLRRVQVVAPAVAPAVAPPVATASVSAAASPAAPTAVSQQKEAAPVAAKAPTPPPATTAARVSAAPPPSAPAAPAPVVTTRPTPAGPRPVAAPAQVAALAPSAPSAPPVRVIPRSPVPAAPAGAKPSNKP